MVSSLKKLSKQVDVNNVIDSWNLNINPQYDSLYDELIISLNNNMNIFIESWIWWGKTAFIDYLKSKIWVYDDNVIGSSHENKNSNYVIIDISNLLPAIFDWKFKPSDLFEGILRNKKNIHGKIIIVIDWLFKYKNNENMYSNFFNIMYNILNNWEYKFLITWDSKNYNNISNIIPLLYKISLNFDTLSVFNQSNTDWFLEKFIELYKLIPNSMSFDSSKSCLNKYNIYKKLNQFKKISELDILNFFKDYYGINKKVFSKEDIKKTSINIKNNIIWQDAQINSILSNIFLNKILNKKPTWVFMLLWPTWVGKTETAKQIAKELYWDSKKTLIIPMNEYQHSVDLYSLTWSKPWFVWFDETDTLADKLNRIWEWVIIFDEIEKAHDSFFTFILKWIEEWYIEMSNWKTAYLNNFTLIFTSNLIQDISDITKSSKTIGFNSSSTSELISQKEIILNDLKKSFKPEFLGRFDNFIIFNQLSEDNLLQILNNKLDRSRNDLLKDVKEDILSKKEISNLYNLTDEEKNEIIQESKKLKLWWRYIEKKIIEVISLKFNKVLGL